jgi:thiol:disulfide interchange protein DsbC
MGRKLSLALVGLSLSTVMYGLSFADDTSSCKSLEEIKQIVRQKFLNTEFAVEKSPMTCIYELWTNNGQVLYTDGNYLFIGHMVDFSGKDLTQAKIDDRISKELLAKVDKLDKSKLFKIGSGPVEIIEFTDPECPYCRRAEAMLESVKDKITRYIVFMPLPFHQNARSLTEYILCNGTEKAYKDVFSGKVDLSKFKCSSEKREKVEKVIDEHMSMAQEFGVRGTPTFIIKTAEGYKVIPGANPEIINIIEKEYKNNKEKNKERR